jgi:hypothetical protein
MRKTVWLLISFILLFGIIIGINIFHYNKKDVSKEDDTGVLEPMDIKTDLEKLKSLPYLGFVVDDPAPEKKGVVSHDNNLSFSGINIYNSNKLPGAYLIDMDGHILHSWNPKKSHWRWHFVRLLENGDLIVVIKDNMLMKISWLSRIKWTIKWRFHHEVLVSESGDVYSLTRNTDWISHKGMDLPILNDYLIILNRNGELKKRISFYKMLCEIIPPEKLNKIADEVRNDNRLRKDAEKPIYFINDSIFDLFHINTLEIIKKSSNKTWKKGNILFCSKRLNVIGIIDPDEEKLLWSYGKDVLIFPHYPTILDNGNILIFDNGNEEKRKYSRIIELNPQTEKIIWEYKGTPTDSFFSKWGGANQELPNGNILITDSAHGYVFEITRQGKVVWEFYNPHRAKEGGRATIYRMLRITDPKLYNGINERLRNSK